MPVLQNHYLTHFYFSRISCSPSTQDTSKPTSSTSSSSSSSSDKKKKKNKKHKHGEKKDKKNKKSKKDKKDKRHRGDGGQDPKEKARLEKQWEFRKAAAEKIYNQAAQLANKLTELTSNVSFFELPANGTAPVTTLMKQLTQIQQDCVKVTHSIVAPLPIESVNKLPSKDVAAAVKTVNKMFIAVRLLHQQ